MDASPRVLIVGAGFMGTLHARTVQASPLATLCGVVDRDAAAGAAAAARFEVPAYTDLWRAVEQTRPYAAVVATPDPVHREAVEVLALAGVHLLVEKPLATSVEDAQAIVALAERHGVRLMPGHILRFEPRCVQASTAVHSGQTGRPVLVGAARWGRTSLGARVGATTSPLWHFLIHDIDLVQWVSGGVIAHVEGAVRVDSPAGLSTLTATGLLSTGAAFHLATGWTLPDGTPEAYRASLEVHGERGHLHLAAEQHGLTVSGQDGAAGFADAGWPTVHGEVDGPLRRQFEHFVSAIIDGGAFAVTAEDGLRAVRGAAAIEAACVIRRLT
ncbi:Gfo/Idh/MocA family protein [Phytohabitans kaempferiae]|uniref:Gfo/Idh/MocA family protein n=1 Tax=Phytohabitans kaempferiae TaxID=1620943 RepID=A0ABV6M731_9ACTN